MCRPLPNISWTSFYGNVIKVVPDALCIICSLWSGSVLLEQEKKEESKREGLWTFIKWPTRLQTCQSEAQNWVSCLMLALQTCADSWPSVNNAAVSRTWPGSPHTLSFPWALGESTPQHNTRSCLCSTHWNIHLLLEGNHQLSLNFIPLLCFHGTRQEVLHFKFTFSCSFKFSCI